MAVTPRAAGMKTDTTLFTAWFLPCAVSRGKCRQYFFPWLLTPLFRTEAPLHVCKNGSARPADIGPSECGQGASTAAQKGMQKVYATHQQVHVGIRALEQLLQLRHLASSSI